MTFCELMLVEKLRLRGKETMCEILVPSVRCMCYIRSEGIDGDVICCILARKPILAETKASTIFRLKLEAALDAVKLIEDVKRELKLSCCSCTYQTNSRNVLSHWFERMV